MAGNTVEVNIIGRESVSGEIAKVIAALNALKDKTVKVNLEVDRKELGKNINKAVDGYNKSPARQRLDLDVDQKYFRKAVRDAINDVSKGGRSTIDVDVDGKKAKKELGELRKLVEAISKDKIDIDINVDAGDSAKKAALVAAALEALKDKEVDVKVNVDDDELDHLDRETSGSRAKRKIDVEVDVTAPDENDIINERDMERHAERVGRKMGSNLVTNLTGPHDKNERFRAFGNRVGRRIGAGVDDGVAYYNVRIREKLERLGNVPGNALKNSINRALTDDFDADRFATMLQQQINRRRINIQVDPNVDYNNLRAVGRQAGLDLADQINNRRLRVNNIIDNDQILNDLQRLRNMSEDQLQTIRVKTHVIHDNNISDFQLPPELLDSNEVVNRYVRERIHIDSEVVGGASRARVARMADGWDRLSSAVGRYNDERRIVWRQRGDAFDNGMLRGMRSLSNILGLHGGRNGIFDRAARGSEMFTNSLASMTSRIPVLRGLFGGLAKMTSQFSQMGRAGGALGALGKVLGPVGAIATGAAALYSIVQIMGAVGVLGTSALAAGLFVANGAMAVGIGLASGLAGVIGGALAGGLIAVAAQAPEVQEAFSNLGTHVTDTMKDVTSNLVPALVDMAPKLQSAFDQVVPSLRRMSKGTEQLMDDLSKDLPAIADAVGPTLEEAFSAGSDHLRIISRNMPELVSSVGKFFDRMDSPAVLEASERFWQRLPSWVDKAGGAVEGTAKAFNNLDEFLTGDKIAPFREGFSNFFKELGNTNWDGTINATASALNSLGSFVKNIDGEQLDGIISNVVDGFDSLTKAAESGGLVTFMEGLTGGFELFADSVKTAGGWIEDVMEHLNIGGRGDSADVANRTKQQVEGIKEAWDSINKDEPLPRFGEMYKSLEGLEGSMQNLKQVSAEAGSYFEDAVVKPLTKLDPRNYDPGDLTKVLDSATFTANMIPKFDNMQIEKAATDVTATIQAEMEMGDLKGADLEAAIGTKNAVLEVAAEISGDNITSALDMIQGLEAAVKLKPEMSTAGFQGMMDGLEIAAKVVPEIESRGDQIMWTAGIEATIPVMPKIEDLGGLGQTLQGISAAVEIIPKLEGAAQSDFIQGFTQSLGKITISAANMDFTGLQDGLNQMEAAINAARISLKLEPIDIPDLIPQNPQLPPVEPPAKPPEVPFVPKPPREWERDPAGNLISKGDPAQLPVDPLLTDPTQKFFNNPVPMPIQPDPVGLGAFDAMGQQTGPMEVQIVPKFDGAASLGAIPPMEVQILPKFDGAMNFGAIPPMEVQILPKFDGAMSFGAIPPMEVQILPKFDGAMAFGAIPPMEVQIIPKFDGAAAFGLIPPMEVQIIPKFDGAAAFGIIPPMEVQIIPRFDGAAAFGIIPPMEVQIIPKFDGAAALGIIPPIPVQIIPMLGDVALNIPPIPVPVIPQLQGALPALPPMTVPVIPQLQGMPNIPNTSSTHMINVQVGQYTLPGNTSSTHTINVVVGPYSLPGNTSSTHTINVAVNGGSLPGGKGKSAFAGFASGIAGFASGVSGLASSTNLAAFGDIPGLIGAAMASGGASMSSISSAGQRAGEAYGEGFTKGAEKTMSAGVKDSFDALRKEGDRLMAREKVAKSTGPGVIWDLYGRPTFEDLSMPKLSLKEEDEYFRLTGQYKDARDRAYYLAYWGGWSMLTDEEIAMVKDEVLAAQKFDKEANKAFSVMKDADYTVGKLSEVSDETLMKLADSWENTKGYQNRDPRMVQQWANRRENLQEELKHRGLIDKWAKNRKEETKIINENANPKVAAIQPLGIETSAPANQINEGARQVQEAWVNFGNAMNSAIPGANLGGLVNSIVPPDLAAQISSAFSNIQFPPIDLSQAFQIPDISTIMPDISNIIPPDLQMNIQSNANQVMNDIQQMANQFIQPHMDVLTNIPEVQQALDALNNQNTESEHTVNMNVQGQNQGGGKPVGFGGIGTFAGINGVAGMEGAASASGIRFTVTSNLLNSMILISDTIRGAISHSWAGLGASVMGSFIEGIQNFNPSGIIGWLSNTLGRIFGRGATTISVYEDGVLVSKSLAQGIRAGGKIIVKSADEAIGDAVFTPPKMVWEKPDPDQWGFNFDNGSFNFNWDFGNFLDFFGMRTTSMSAGYLNEHGQMVVYNVYDQSTQNNHFDGGLVGDPEKQAKRVLDVLSTAHQGRKFQMTLGSS